MRRRLLSLAGWTYSLGIAAFLLLPVAIMVPASFGAGDALEFPPAHLSLRWYAQVLGDEQWLASAWLSARIGLMAAAAAAAGLMIGLAHARLGGIGAGLRAYLMLPLVAPHIVLATGLFSVLLELHRLGDPLVLGLAHACLALPFSVILFIGAIDTIDPLLWTAASTLGARASTILRQIILPNLAVSAVVALVLGFVVSWDEVTFAVFIGPTVVPTLPSRMFSYLKELINPSLAAIATLLVGMTLLAGLLLLAIERRRCAGTPAAPLPQAAEGGHGR